MQANDSQPGFFVRLRQHHIYRVAAAYGAAIAVLIQIVARAFPYFGWSGAVPAVIIILIAGFPVALVIAWLWVKPADSAQQTAWQKWHWKLGAIVVPSVIAAVVVSGIYAFQLSKRHETRVAAEGAVAQATVKSGAAPAAATVIPAQSIAVLPFENLSADKNNAYFADGMQDLILTKLADIGDLKVIARTSTESYGSHPENLSKIGDQLGVATLLEGSVQKAGNQVLINVQLIDAKTDAHIWAQSYQRTLNNIFGVEGEVAEKVAEALNAKLSPAETARVARVLTTNPQAYTLYLKAQYDVHQLAATTDFDQIRHSIQNAIPLLKQAITLDPKFAAAYARLATAEVMLFNTDAHTSNPSAFPPMAEAYARKALALQPDLAAGHLALAFIYRDKNAGFKTALQQAQLAASLAPGHSVLMLSLLYQDEGAWQQAYDATHKAVLLDPRNVGSYLAAAHISARLRRYADARQMLERGLAVSPDNMVLHENMGDLLLVVGQATAARTRFTQLPDSDDNKFYGLSHTWALSRNYTQALKLARQIPASKHAFDAGSRAWAVGHYARLAGEKADADAAFAQARSEIQATLQRLDHVESSGDSPLKPALYRRLALVEAQTGHRDAALRAIDKATKLDASSAYRPPGSNLRQFAASDFETKAEILAQFGDAAGATDILRKLFDTQGTGWLISVPLLKLDPVWDPIRSDPRFQALLKKYAQHQPSTSAVTTSAASAES